MIDPEFLKMLCCPETRQPLSMAPTELLNKINAGIAAGTVRNRNGEPVTVPCDGGLLRKDGQFLYPIRDAIPVMLMAEALPVV